MTPWAVDSWPNLAHVSGDSYVTENSIGAIIYPFLTNPCSQLVLRRLSQTFGSRPDQRNLNLQLAQKHPLTVGHIIESAWHHRS